jgi:NAD(P)-dependent dehydrogenase (short-subunit alcohol dehydrogenase family)
VSQQEGRGVAWTEERGTSDEGRRRLRSAPEASGRYRRLVGKIAIITGAASGIGQATARRVAAEGARTVVADLDAAGAKQVAGEIGAAGGEATAVQVDLGEVDSVRAMVRAAVTAYGGLDILHNNAAATRLAATADLPVSAADPDVWDDTMRVNLRGAMVAIQAAVPHMMARGGGSVINTSSGSGLTGDLRNPAYGASKAALISLTRYVATEFGKQGIRCNAISPGFIVIGSKPGREAVHATMLRHALTPRLGRPEDIAALVVFLASDESAFITGQNICVDGGMLAHQPFVADFRELQP